MSFDEIVIDVDRVTKKFDVYANPRDRLKQFVLPRFHDGLNRLAASVGIVDRKPPPVYFKEFWALREISFQVRRGQTLGIIGRNGSGKSTLLQIIAGTLAPTAGEVRVRGRVAALLELGSGFNPEFTGRENVFLNARILGLSQADIEHRFDRIVEFADIGEFIDQPVKTYSSGMFVRLAFAVQAHIDASIVIIDEALAVGDVFFRQKCYARLEALRESGAAIILVSHSMPDIEQYCEQAILLDQGSCRFIGPSAQAAKHYYLLHQPPAQTPSGAAAPRSAEKRVPAGAADEHGLVDRPVPEAFVDLVPVEQIGTGQARCVGVAVCDQTGQACRSFHQGERAVFWYEFELVADIGVPVCGIVISNERGTIVFGKHTWQYPDASMQVGHAGDRVYCRQEVLLDLAVGEYTIEVGLAAASERNWNRRHLISHDETASIFHRICHLNSVAAFSIGLANRNGVSVLLHHGVANLPGSMHSFVRKSPLIKSGEAG